MANPGNFEVWGAAGAVQIVAMGKVEFLDFRVRDAIGTGQLAQCLLYKITNYP